MSTPGSVVVWEWLFYQTHWLPYEPLVSNHIETAHSQWLAKSCHTSAWPTQTSVSLSCVSSSLAKYVVELTTMSQTNQATGTYDMVLFIRVGCEYVVKYTTDKLTWARVVLS